MGIEAVATAYGRAAVALLAERVIELKAGLTGNADADKSVLAANDDEKVGRDAVQIRADADAVTTAVTRSVVRSRLLFVNVGEVRGVL